MASGPYVGSEACAECHADIFEQQKDSPHARTLLVMDAEWAKRHIPPGVRKRDPATGTEYALEERESGYAVVAYKDGKEIGAARIDYLLGSGHHGVTPLSFDGGEWRYLPLSYYAHGGWDFSPTQSLSGGEGGKAGIGLPVTMQELRKCFTCHATQLEFAGNALDSKRTELGVKCESCHGPGRAHVEAARAKSPDLAVQNPGKWSTTSFMALCQQCHNETATLEGTLFGIPKDPANPSIAKYQVHGLQQSPCYLKSEGRMRCTTCHDPHRPVETSSEYYRVKCMSCHQPQQAGHTTCPVQPRGDCLPCHMPKVQVEKHTYFADHWIRARSPFAKGM